MRIIEGAPADVQTRRGPVRTIPMEVSSRTDQIIRIQSQWSRRGQFQFQFQVLHCARWPVANYSIGSIGNRIGDGLFSNWDHKFHLDHFALTLELRSFLWCAARPWAISLSTIQWRTASVARWVTHAGGACSVLRSNHSRAASDTSALHVPKLTWNSCVASVKV